MTPELNFNSASYGDVPEEAEGEDVEAKKLRSGFCP